MHTTGLQTIRKFSITTTCFGSGAQPFSTSWHDTHRHVPLGQDPLGSHGIHSGCMCAFTARNMKRYWTLGWTLQNFDKYNIYYTLYYIILYYIILYYIILYYIILYYIILYLLYYIIICLKVVASKFCRKHFVSEKFKLCKYLSCIVFKVVALFNYTLLQDCKYVGNIPGSRIVKTFSALSSNS